MSKSVVELNSSAVRDFLKSPEMEQMCREIATQACNRCGPGYETDSYQGRNRVNAMVWAESKAAKRDNSKNNTILKALRT